VHRSLLALGLAGLWTLATSAGQTPQFRAGIDLVHLDVSVLDRDRQPVRGLTPADFTILEDGVPQNIAVFTAVDIADPEPPSTGWMRDVGPDVRSNEGVEERRLLLIVIDDATLQGDPRVIANVRRIARSIIDRLGPSDLAAVVFTRDNRRSQDYTADRARLIAAVDGVTQGFRDMSPIGGMDDLYFMYSANVLEQAVRTLSTLPDRRKVVLYVGQGVPVDLELAATPVLAETRLPEADAVSTLARQGVMEQMRTQMSRAFENAARANVNIYTIDACGLRLPAATATPTQTCLQGLEMDYLLTLAANTNAHAIINTNDFEPGVQAVFDENASYYLLGYQSSNAREDGKFRDLEVRVNRPGLEIRTRSGYQAEKANDAARRRAALVKAPLGAALAGVLPKGDLPLQVMAAPFPLTGRRESAVAVVLGVRQPIRVSAERTIEKVDLQVTAYNVEGKSFGSRRLQADVVIRPGATGLAEYEVLSSLELKPGRYQLRIAASVGSLSTSGSLYYDVDVPDVSKAQVTLSPIVLSVTPGPVSAPREGLRTFLPVVPTTRREFGPGDRVTAFTRVYQRPKGPVVAVPLRITITDATGRVALQQPVDLGADRFVSDRASDVSIDLPTNTLPEGDLLLTVEGRTGDAPPRSAVRFRIAR
jgi:VWFA-related protein